MYLKSIEIHGFKSFANKMVFEFHDGITAIVGPNGSGKSNVADAVRWVLGEQSAKQLRGAKMEDVIFSGTQARKPQGSAYVAITLDNSDHKLATSYEEVTVARRVYRSGESEYLLNGTGCRLKDVQELFLDTGIGKEGYSIIGQGQIDKILSGKPEERRELFDEAAGIVKFKKRKAAAEKNLESEKLNLSRVKDILAEIEKQLKPLERQSDVAREYLKLRDDLKVLDVNMFLLEYERISESRKQLEEKDAVAREELESIKADYENTGEEYGRLELVLEEYSRKLESDKMLISEHRIKREQLEGRIKVLNEQIIAARQNDTHYKNRRLAVEEQTAVKQKQLEEYRKEKEETGSLILDQDTMCRDSERLLNQLKEDITAFERQVEEHNSDIFELLSENASIKTRMQRYETMLEQSTLKKAGLNQRILKYKSDEAVYDEAISREKENLQTVSARIKSVQADTEENSRKVRSLNETIDQYKKDHIQNQQDVMREKSRLDSLKNMTERYEGYGQSIRRIMEQKDRINGIIGVVADIIKVDKKYEMAMEIALGGNIQNIVTDNENTAKQLIGFLKQNKYGRATFLPLTTVNGSNVFRNEGALKEEGVIGLASILAEYDSCFQGLVESLLGRIIVVDHIDHAIALQRKYHSSLRIVTLEGELLNPGGSMSGGAYKNSSNLLGRRRELEDIEIRIRELEKELKVCGQKIEELKKEKNAVNSVIEENKKVLQELYLEQNTAKLKYNQAESDKESMLENYHEINREHLELESQIRELKENIGQLSGQLTENEQKKKERESMILLINGQLEEKKGQELKDRELLAALKLESSRLEQNNRFVMENMKRVTEELNKLRNELSMLEMGMEESHTHVSDKETEIEEIKNKMNELDSMIGEADGRVRETTDFREKVTVQHKSFFAKREELSKRIIDLEREESRLAGQLDKLSDQLEQQINYMWEEYELTYHNAADMKTDLSLTLPQMKKVSGDLKGKMKGLGEVNVNAIEDYKNLSGRHMLLKTQHDDLVQAEEVLKGIIEELDSEMRKQFTDKFEQIRVQFDIVFRELFGGGKGTLELLEDEDVLEAGIRIIAQPPGKKLQNMMQLSGGEKALTAISLLFAIQNLKPSPFCLLDEIEAALDDSNVGRYAKYLHKLTKETQFIVITHRRGTMAAADILYGITMQEKGVSTLVSVNLIEDELEKEEKGTKKVLPPPVISYS